MRRVLASDTDILIVFAVSQTGLQAPSSAALNNPLCSPTTAATTSSTIGRIKQSPMFADYSSYSNHHHHYIISNIKLSTICSDNRSNNNPNYRLYHTI
ncbi:hypothetical protein PoB_003636500 [Plakobranchus ocellatus]|uniref:Uncharacterized protein n=1 Tax=Plakobranchus ocellatus TaxID=259542 RepID=A0AAV4ARB6_9GAST|nr:hypothetical protein PoB_003636500 [Plakobranchus ocellatus]